MNKRGVSGRIKVGDSLLNARRTHRIIIIILNAVFRGVVGWGGWGVGELSGEVFIFRLQGAFNTKRRFK